MLLDICTLNVFVCLKVFYNETLMTATNDKKKLLNYYKNVKRS